MGRITTTIIAPTPLVAANFILLGQIINILGLRYSRLSATWCTFDILTGFKQWMLMTILKQTPYSSSLA